jgi:L-seryl-tRNA(Ser) seleniumtransferase
MDPNREIKASATRPEGGDPRRSLPSVDLLAREIREAEPTVPLWAATAAARRVLAAARRAGRDAVPAPDALRAEVRAVARDLARPRPGRVVNATGVVLHTNLGRAVLAPGAAEAVAGAASRYGDLELERAGGGRGDRGAALAALLVALSGAEDALAVNNNAAALLLAVDTLARGREVVVSRGELVEIGGSFRVPEIVEKAGAKLVEVGTTNRTHPEDYRRAAGPRTACFLKVHRSNFEQRGFVAEVDLGALVALGAECGVAVVEDLGSGTLLDLRPLGLPEASFAPGRLATGADLVCFSGDKLLGGPQAGILLGRAPWIRKARGNPLARALRLGKLSVAALDWTLRAQLEDRAQEIPTVRQLAEPAQAVEARARALAEQLAKTARGRLAVTVAPTRSPVGGGSLPGFELDSWAVEIRTAQGAPALAEALRAAPVPLLGRLRDEALLLDARTLLPGDAEECVSALATVLRAGTWEPPC